mmetsp:Transcript_6506/g.16612  ORF Transcript_6506/g.16612 Transcript_6506/m.16612 type:complete len:207 (+) Transcript_6506:853-1473(+)
MGPPQAHILLPQQRAGRRARAQLRRVAQRAGRHPARREQHDGLPPRAGAGAAAPAPCVDGEPAAALQQPGRAVLHAAGPRQAGMHAARATGAAEQLSQQEDAEPAEGPPPAGRGGAARVSHLGHAGAAPGAAQPREQRRAGLHALVRLPRRRAHRHRAPPAVRHLARLLEGGAAWPPQPGGWAAPGGTRQGGGGDAGRCAVFRGGA